MSSSITGSAVTRAGGGGGGSNGYATSNGNAGSGGGGRSGVNPTVNTGSGGGGADRGGSGATTGASGIVILRFPTASGTPTIGSGLTSSTSTDGSDTIIQFTAGTDTITW